MFAAALALVFALLVPVPFGSSDCSDVHVIGARGSGQPAGYGEQVGPIVDAVLDSAWSQGRSATAAALDYPAISVSDSFGLVLLTGDYDASVRAGVGALIGAIDERRVSCPSSDLVLVGYSQGAQVIKLALADAPSATRIAAVVLLADPTRNPDDVGLVRLGDPTLEAEGAFGAIALPDFFRTVAIDVCAEGDGVCERTRRSLTAHTEGYQDAAQHVVPWLRAEFDDRLASISRWR